MQLFHFLGIIARKAFKDFKGDTRATGKIQNYWFTIVSFL